MDNLADQDISPSGNFTNEMIQSPSNNKRKSESMIENDQVLNPISKKSINQPEISPSPNPASSSLANNREKRIRKQKSYDDNYVMYDLPLPSLSSSFSPSTHSNTFSNPIKPSFAQNQNLTPISDIKFNVGDLVWAKVSGHPWWPCIISNPHLSLTTTIKDYVESKTDQTHVKTVGASNRQKSMYYVEFFGPSIEHAWVFESCLSEYKGVEAFKSYALDQVNQQTNKSVKEKLTEKYQLKVTLPKRDQWEKALREADGLINKRVRDRKLYFIKKHANLGQVKKSVNPPKIEPSSPNIESTKIEKCDDVEEKEKTSQKFKQFENENLDENSSICFDIEHDINSRLNPTENEASTNNDLNQNQKQNQIDESELFQEKHSKGSLKILIKLKPEFKVEYLNENENLLPLNHENKNADSHLIDRYNYAARHIRQGLSVDQACNKYRISKSALLKCLNGGSAPRGKRTRLTEHEENLLVEWLISDTEIKYSDAINLVFDQITKIFEDSQRQNPFQNGKPSVDWWYDFLSRHPQIMASKPDWIMRGKINDDYIRDVQSGKLKCTKFRRALLSAIQYINSMNEGENCGDKSGNENENENENETELDLENTDFDQLLADLENEIDLKLNKYLEFGSQVVKIDKNHLFVSNDEDEDE